MRECQFNNTSIYNKDSQEPLVISPRSRAVGLGMENDHTATQHNHSSRERSTNRHVELEKSWLILRTKQRAFPRFGPLPTLARTPEIAVNPPPLFFAL